MQPLYSLLNITQVMLSRDIIFFINPLIHRRNFWLAAGSKPVFKSFSQISDTQCVFLEDSRRHCIFL